jgi:hypothetical protein
MEIPRWRGRQSFTGFVCALLVALLALGGTYPAPAIADTVKATVVYNKRGCRDRYVVETSGGYAILEWYGGNDPSEGDVLVGDIHSFGFKDLYNLTQNSRTRVWIDDYMLSKYSLQSKFFEKFCS